MNEEQIIRILERLGNMLEGPSKELFAIVMKQQMVVAINSALWFFALLVSTIALIALTVSSYKRAENDGSNSEWWIGVALFGVLAVAAFFTMFWPISDVLQRVMNPELHALREIAKLISPIK